MKKKADINDLSKIMPVAPPEVGALHDDYEYLIHIVLLTGDQVGVRVASYADLPDALATIFETETAFESFVVKRVE